MSATICLALGMFMQAAALKLKDDHSWSAVYFAVGAIIAISGVQP